MKARLFSALLGAMALCVSSPSFAQNQGGNQGGNKGGNQGGNGGKGSIAAPEFDGQMVALGLALASGAAIVVRGRFRRPRK